MHRKVFTEHIKPSAANFDVAIKEWKHFSLKLDAKRKKKVVWFRFLPVI